MQLYLLKPILVYDLSFSRKFNNGHSPARFHIGRNKPTGFCYFCTAVNSLINNKLLNLLWPYVNRTTV